MKRAFLAPLAMLAALLAFSIWNSLCMTVQTQRWQSQLQTARAQAQSDNWPAALATLEAGYADWSSCQTYLQIVTQHNVANNAESMYHRAMAFAMTGESSEFQAEIADLMDQLQLLAEMEKFSLGNILTSLPAAYSALP